MHQIVILGAGYAGLATATTLAGLLRGRDGVRVTVVTASERFTERLRLHQTATGQTTADLRIPDLLAGTGIDLITGWVTEIDPAATTVRVDSERETRTERETRNEREIGYDTLVFALGGTADTSAVPGVSDHAYTLDSPATAQALARRLAELGSGTVAVCGAGLTGIEAAAEIAERHPRLKVTLIGAREPGAGMSARARRHLDAALTRLGVRVIAGATITKVLPNTVEMDGTSNVAADVVLWTGGVLAVGLATVFETDDTGRIVTDSSLRSVSHPEVYAVGDAAAIRQGYGVLHGTCQSGMPTGVHVANAIMRDLEGTEREGTERAGTEREGTEREGRKIAGREPERFRFGHLHTPVSLGRRDAVVQFTRPDGSAKPFALTGRVAVWYKETVSAAPWPSFQRLLRMPVTGRFAWRRGGGYTR
ncbi:NAD(P)/FAD-dependent oxidoreductase [Actinoplanes sp. GCM10030250]|uniref:NAD(P)/FAD-dependent oxidoreductase n=1 Tax=Actinoplanes sp. GCM10030250 TaxID=3273376 RepID=UPI003617C190